MTEKEFPFGIRYLDAHLSKIDLPPEIMEKLNNWIKKPKSMLVFIGNPGVGKTYFCAAIYNYFMEQFKKNPSPNPHKDKIFYFTENEFLRTVRHSISEKGGDYSHKIETMANYECRFWILDDIGSNQMTEWQKEVLLTFVDEAYQNKKPMVITSNVWLKDMKTFFSYRFQSRLAASENTIIELNWDDKRQQGL